MAVRPAVLARRMTAALFCGALALFGSAPPRAAVVRQIPEQKIFKSDEHQRLVTFLYAPKAGETKGTPVIFFSGEWGWRPLQQDTASYLASVGRIVLGIDSPTYFDDIIPGEGLASDLAKFRGFANERAGRPKESPVILVGFASGGEMIPYILNQTGADGARGAILIAPDRQGAKRFRVSIQLKMDSPAGEAFDVEHELRKMAPIPVVFMEGTLDHDSAARGLSTVTRGPHKYVQVEGGDRQFHEAREGLFTILADALRWIDNTRPAPTPRPAAPAGSPAVTPADTPAPPPLP